VAPALALALASALCMAMGRVKGLAASACISRWNGVSPPPANCEKIDEGLTIPSPTREAIDAGWGGHRGFPLSLARVFFLACTRAAGDAGARPPHTLTTFYTHALRPGKALLSPFKSLSALFFTETLSISRSSLLAVTRFTHSPGRRRQGGRGDTGGTVELRALSLRTPPPNPARFFQKLDCNLEHYYSMQMDKININL
jgi:hypothetical protein